MSWRVHRERLLLLGWGRAILLQFAHPLVAQAVADHSAFRDERFGGWRRLHRTLGAMLALTFGAPDDVRAAARRINAVHARVAGLAGGVAYAATDPALLRWVHATCVDSFLAAHELYVEPLAAAERDAYCAEAAGGAALLGLDPDALPRDVAALRAYMDGMWRGGDLEVTPTARALARAVLYPRPAWLGWPVVGAVRLSTLGLLPAPVRTAYGFAWSPGHERRFASLARRVRRLRGMLPAPLAYWGVARRAMRRASG